MKWLRSSVVAAAVFLGCSGGALPYIGPEPGPNIVEQPGKEGCAAACARMDSLNCEEGQDVPLADGGMATCTDFCIYQHENSVFWNTSCLRKITECAQIESQCNTQ